MTSVDKPGPNIMAFAGLGLMNAICLVGAMAVGWGVDSALGTSPLFIMIGLILGVLVGVFVTRAELKRWG
ncbi:MAG TPA: hypothetical protein VG184_04355 [Acidimicrobiales bacterium]|nr:hypothetical protein [Acidimicrobiales bacterium]